VTVAVIGALNYETLGFGSKRKIPILARAGYGSTSRKVRRPQICEIGGSVVLVDHFSAGASPTTDRRAVDVGFHAKADEGMPALVALAVKNIRGFEDGSPGAGRKVVLIDKFALRTGK